MHLKQFNCLVAVIVVLSSALSGCQSRRNMRPEMSSSQLPGTSIAPAGPAAADPRLTDAVPNVAQESALSPVTFPASSELPGQRIGSSSSTCTSGCCNH